MFQSRAVNKIKTQLYIE